MVVEDVFLAFPAVVAGYAIFVGICATSSAAVWVVVIVKAQEEV